MYANHVASRLLLKELRRRRYVHEQCLAVVDVCHLHFYHYFFRVIFVVFFFISAIS